MSRARCVPWKRRPRRIGKGVRVFPTGGVYIRPLADAARPLPGEGEGEGEGGER